MSKELKKILKQKISNLERMQKYPPRYYAYKMMLKHIREEIYFKDIFNEEILKGLSE